MRHPDLARLPEHLLRHSLLRVVRAACVGHRRRGRLSEDPEIDTTTAQSVELPKDAEVRLDAAMRADDAAASVRSLTDLPGLEVQVEGTRVYAASGGITGYWTGRVATDCLLGWKVEGEVGVERLSAGPHDEPVSCGWEDARARVVE